MANERDPQTGKPVVYVGINGKKFYIPTNELVTMPFEVFCVLKDANIIGDIDKYSIDEGINPLDKYV